MAATIKIKNSSTAGAAPTSSDLVQGELAVNVTDKRLYTENASGTVVELGTNPSVPVTFPDGSASAPSLTNDGDTNTGLFFPAADTVGIATGGTERARIDSSGKFSVSSASTTAGLYVENTTSGSSAYAAFVKQTDSTFAGNVFSVVGSRTTTNGSYLLCQMNNGNGSGLFKVLDSGNCQNTNNSYGSSSDIKLKENIVDATPKLAQLQQVRIVNYNLIGQEQKQIGVIAQELEQVFPSMVEEVTDRDEEGNDLGTTTKSVKYSVFVPMLIKAIQELKAEFDAYKATHP